MDGQSRAGRPPRDVRREFIGCRLESQLLVRAYELAVPVARRQAVTARMQQLVSAVAGERNRVGLVAQGA